MSGFWFLMAVGAGLPTAVFAYLRYRALLRFAEKALAREDAAAVIAAAAKPLTAGPLASVLSRDGRSP
jgi:hypothetical protein